MSEHQDDEKKKLEDEFEEPPLEDFLLEEEGVDHEEEARLKKRKQTIIRTIAISISLLLVVNVLSIWLNVFSLDSIKLLQGTAEYSEDEMVQESMESVVLIQHDQSRGTGFIVSSDGYIISNDHVVDGSGPLAVTLSSGEQHVASIIERDDELDLALLKIEAEGLPYLPLSDEPAGLDERVLVIGNPLMQQQIVNEGSVLEQTGGFEVLRISAPIYGGHSGSPVLTEEGTVVGVVYARTIPGFFADEPSRGLAVPIRLVKEQFDDLLSSR
ncbi:S1C family serine protease [Bacillus sp. FJAT-45037]|uniref:S1C family serine protease n=1 Tax=Bacillus sp. FJAT-45037 TaxID=2011007 RepID=UPI001E38464F|nr:serine protease [Bacillus sp. FJAT-45037]